MLGNFSYHNPTKLYFGEASLDKLKDELANFGEPDSRRYQRNLEREFVIW